MQFNTDYYHSMDRGYFNDEVNESEQANPAGTISMGEIGTSVDERQTATGQMSQQGNVVDAFQYGIRQGAKNVEIAMKMDNAQGGTGTGSYGQEQRAEIRKLSEINDTHITTIHSPVEIGNLSGRGEKGYNEQNREREINEIRKAIHFAADVTTGKKQTGVVIHTGEFARPLEEVGTGEEKGLFTSAAPSSIETGRQSEKEKWGKLGESPIKTIIDSRTGETFAQVRKDDTFRIYEGFDKKNGKAKFSEQKWQYFENLAKENPQEYKSAEDAWLKKTHLEEQKDSIKINRNYQDVYYGEQINRYSEGIETLNKKLSKKKEIVGQNPRTGEPIYKDFTNQELQNIANEKENLEKAKRTYEDYRIEALKKADLDLEKFKEQQKHLVTEQDYALEKSLDSFSQLGIEAMRASETNKLEKGVYVAPENIFPQMGYGSHPDEMIELVTKSRNLMSNKLQQMGYSEEKAKQEAKEHIKTTFDTEHLGMWFQYFKRDNPNLSEADRRKEFNKWFMKQVDKMEKADIIGHVHIADSFGYGHTNSVAGEGMLPL